MFESIRRAREVKKAEAAERAASVVPQKQELPSIEPDAPQEERPIEAPAPARREQPDMSRRNFLRGVGATALAVGVESAIPSFLSKDIAQARGLEGEAGIRERERLMDEMVASLKQAVNAPDVRGALSGRGDRLISRILRPIQMPIDASFVKGTKYDASKERMDHGVQVVYQRAANGRNAITFVPAKAGQSRYAPPGIGYGNGFYFGRADKVVTAQHVYEDAAQVPHQGGVRDISVMSVSENVRARPEQVVQDDTSLSNADIHGAFVSIEGIDPDATSAEGCKSYPGVAMRLSREWVNSVFVNSSREHNERLSRCFVIALPPGESRGDKPADKPAAGMSGSPVWMLRNGRKVLAGIFVMNIAVQDPETKRTIDLGFFQGIEEIREQYGTEMRSGA